MKHRALSLSERGPEIVCQPHQHRTDIGSHGAVASPPFECRSIRPGPPYIHIWNERLGADIITTL
jgi:hypothetical protein